MSWADLSASSRVTSLWALRGLMPWDEEGEEPVCIALLAASGLLRKFLNPSAACMELPTKDDGLL